MKGPFGWDDKTRWILDDIRGFMAFSPCSNNRSLRNGTAIQRNEMSKHFAANKERVVHKGHSEEGMPCCCYSASVFLIKNPFQ